MGTNPLCCQGENVRIKGNKEKEWMAQIDAQVMRKRHVDYVRTQEEGAQQAQQEGATRLEIG